MNSESSQSFARRGRAHGEGCEPYDVVIIGGGASGLACAVALSRVAARPLRIVVLEEGRRVGASIMRSGNGRCNFSNASIDVARYRSASFVGQALDAVCAQPAFGSVTEWFEGLGLVWEEAPHSGGMLFPFSHKANSVLDVLRAAVDEAGVELRVGARALGVERASAAPGSADLCGGSTSASVRYVVRGEQHELARPKGAQGAKRGARLSKDAAPVPFGIPTRAVVVAVGGGFDAGLLHRAAPDVAVVPWRPLLGPLAASAPDGVSLAALDGVRARARVSVAARSFSEEGEVLFRPYGISGIVVFNASRYARPGDGLSLDLAPGFERARFEALLIRRLERFSQRRAEGYLEGFFVPALAQALMRVARIDPKERLDEEAVLRLAHAIKAFPLTVEGIADERQCQVSRGGVAVEGIDATTMEVRSAPGLYVLGEALDVDAPCGGFNLHWAWSSGAAAGLALARALS